jgi:hypothetical protein
VSARIRAGLKFKRFLCFVLIDVRSFREPPKISSLTLGGYSHPRLKATELGHIPLDAWIAMFCERDGAPTCHAISY